MYHARLTLLYDIPLYPQRQTRLRASSGFASRYFLVSCHSSQARNTPCVAIERLLVAHAGRARDLDARAITEVQQLL